MIKKEMKLIPLFSSPVMEVQLDLDLEKLTEFSFQLQNKGRKREEEDTVVIGGWQSNNIVEEPHEEFKKLKKEINQYLQIYHSEVFQGMTFKENVTQSINSMWVMINEKHHYVDWHIHHFSTLSGAYYIKHDSSSEQGNIMFKHPKHLYMTTTHWPKGVVETPNEMTSETISITPKSNKLLIFPSWLEHRVEANLKNDSRISLSFNSILKPEK